MSPKCPGRTTRGGLKGMLKTTNGSKHHTRHQAVEVIIEDDRTTMVETGIKRAFLDNLYYIQGKDELIATAHDRYMALAYTVRDRLMQRWIASQRAYYDSDAKRVYYLSAEFLMGRYTFNNMTNLGVSDVFRQAMRECGLTLTDLLEEEPDAGLGNGGLGRLAACYLDSLATLKLPAHGYGIRYEFGIFDQEIRDGYQVELPDQWLRFGTPWELARPEHTTVVNFGGRTVEYTDERGNNRVKWVSGERVLGTPYDTPVSGYGMNNANTLRLWRARAFHEFDLAEFDRGDYLAAVEEKAISENISKVLYPNDNSAQGRQLRLKQQYFFVACSLADIVRRYLKTHQNFRVFADKVAIQMNDTHPSIAVAELMRILIDDYQIAWEDAWNTSVRTFGYTNHTLLAEALETWPVDMFGGLLPRHLEIIYEINSRFLDQVRHQWPGDETRVQRMSLIAEEPDRRVRMAHLATVGSHSINGVAALHSQLLQQSVLRDFYELWPERFNNKTNGVTPRRWLLECNPRLAKEITTRIGKQWPIDLDQLEKLRPHAEKRDFRDKLRQIKRENKIELARFVKRTLDIDLNIDSMFDVMVKRLHEYKRQHLNALHIITRYLRLKKNPDIEVVPRTFIFGAKAAPGYAMAKLIIKFITAIADVVNKDPDVKGRYKVVFLPNYRVSLAERLLPAADLSEQISTAGKEASGTSNMKFAMNGALTIGTLDGANIEIRDAVGTENFFLFGLRAEEVEFLKQIGRDPQEPLHNNEELRDVVKLVMSGHFSPGQPELFKPLIDNLLNDDPYMVLWDYASYIRTQEEVDVVFKNPDEWARRCALNVSMMGRFSSDRAVRQYADEIWNLKPVDVTLNGT